MLIKNKLLNVFYVVVDVKVREQEVTTKLRIRLVKIEMQSKVRVKGLVSSVLCEMYKCILTLYFI